MKEMDSRHILKQSSQIGSVSNGSEELYEETRNESQTWFGSFMEVPRVSVVIPTRNEAKNLPYVLPRIPNWVYEVILVDGSSKDGTVEVARSLLPSIRVVNQQGRGKGAALRTGFLAATGDIIVMLDADGSTDPAEIPMFVGSLISGADFAKGSRFVQGGGTEDMEWYRKAGNYAFVLLTRLLFGGHYSDLCFGYNAFWKRVLNRLDLQTTGFEIETEMNIHALLSGLHIAEVGCYEARRLHGVSNLKTIPDGWRVLKTILREYWVSLKEKAQLSPRDVTDSDTEIYPY